MLRTIRRPTRLVRPSVRPSFLRHRTLTTGRPEDSEKREHVRSEPSGPSDSVVSVPLQVKKIREHLRKWSMKKASDLRVRMDEFSATAQVAFQKLGGRVNEVTGYNEIAALKTLVTEHGAVQLIKLKMNKIREEAKAAKAAYEEAVARRSNSQRETNELLQRKSSWNDADVLRFTQLVRADHAYEQEEAQAQSRVAEVEASVERQFSELMRAILTRYHEEQVWSDKIRSASTYGSLAALGLNLVVFVLAIVLVEPWKRKRLVQSFERRVIELNETSQRVVENGLKELKEQQGEQERILEEIRALQGIGKEGSVAAVTIHDSGELEAVESVPTAELERNAKTARDRQIIALSVATSLGASIIGYIVGSHFS
ncbi:SHE9 [Sanghuangporus vaninii]